MNKIKQMLEELGYEVIVQRMYSYYDLRIRGHLSNFDKMNLKKGGAFSFYHDGMVQHIYVKR